MLPNHLCSRRHFLHANGFGLGSLALAWLLKQDGLLAAPEKPNVDGPIHYDLLPKTPNFEPQAKAMICLFMMGGPSQMDLFDPKPMLQKYDGQKFPGEIKYDNLAQASSKVLGSPWKFSKHGQCGMELSELLPYLSEVVDDITLIRSMQSGVSNHAQGLYAINNGRISAGRPTVGSWLTYGLGSETQELPAYMVLAHPGGLPTFQGEHFTNGWLPALYQGTLIRPTEPHILNLDPPAELAGKAQDRQLDLLKSLNEEHLAQHPGELDLEARISSYQLAARMQTAAKEALDISSEPDYIKKLYGVDKNETKDYATRCIIARRLIERGVRYVQVLNSGQSWDQHSSLISALPKNCAAVDQPSAALVTDLKQRGLLDSTVVQWGGEMGRLPVLQNDAGRDKWGRDHNTFGFTHWVAGGGFKGGYVHGETDEWSHHAVKDIVHHYDWHATLLHNFGLDYQKLVYKRNGTNASLVDGQEARIVKELLA
ncbi:protein of unknown function DUF1501 [Chthoniobacter flavus Ellin428]|uniref:DUF1501 domain-containing protein n=1 Tax=Chthoniobacter flavus Ellin428 TaxID=497964 RepID=B4CWL3_9BACT|nr:DUF1501 domain-containing protein [Chthoniobacter flavus]EDY21805.1 protein of unknown function DUF1501 [Chthoniobacter flavus Ellin428]TCO95734.1 uncharacterized protein DUF1501 [Chthoniobacter flavus]